MWKNFQRLSHVRSFSSVEENIEDEREPEKNPTSKLGSLLRSKANWTNSRHWHVSVYFCQHVHWLCISCLFFQNSSLFKRQASVANWISLSYCVLLQWRFPSRFSCLAHCIVLLNAHMSLAAILPLSQKLSLLFLWRGSTGVSPERVVLLGVWMQIKRIARLQCG